MQVCTVHIEMPVAPPLLQSTHPDLADTARFVDGTGVRVSCKQVPMY